MLMMQIYSRKMKYDLRITFKLKKNSFIVMKRGNLLHGLVVYGNNTVAVLMLQCQINVPCTYKGGSNVSGICNLWEVELF